VTIAALNVPPGRSAVPGVIVMEAAFGPVGTAGKKEIYVDAIALVWLR
jgi:hypothetical protein